MINDKRTAHLALNEKTFLRTESSDKNDGEYRIGRQVILDRLRNLSAVGGTRTLSRGVSVPWFVIWWESFASPAVLQPDPTLTT